MPDQELPEQERPGKLFQKQGELQAREQERPRQGQHLAQGLQREQEREQLLEECLQPEPELSPLVERQQREELRQVLPLEELLLEPPPD